MLRFIKLTIATIVMLAIVLVAVANRELVTVKLLPDPISEVLGLTYAVTLPLFIILLAAVLIGLLLGYLIEWIRERKHRREVTIKARELSKLETEIQKMKKDSGSQEDDVLALLN